MRPTLPVALCAQLLWLCPAAVQAQEPPPADSLAIPPLGDYLDRPVFLDHFLDTYCDRGDLPELREGRVRVQHYPPVDVRDFAWERGRNTDYTWWMQMQEMRFLLPLVASGRDGDRAVAADWLWRWFAVHLRDDRDQKEWGEPMTWGYRALVFVYYLRSEQQRPHPDEDVVGMLLGSILEHQQRMAAMPADLSSNHGFITALGLFETARVYDDPAVRAQACEQLRTLTERAVSERGFHREHSAGYHFVVMRWLDQITRYVATLPAPDDTTLRLLASTEAAMRGAAWYLQDAYGLIPQIGDTDSLRVEFFGAQYRAARTPRAGRVAFDTSAGFAVCKGVGRDRRYLVFRVPSQGTGMNEHAHNDALSVLYEVDGETLLGDSGKYSYQRDARREFFRSGLAHNIVSAAGVVDAPDRRRGPRMVQDARVAVSDTVRFRGAVQYPSFRSTRTVLLPGASQCLVVIDSVQAGSERDMMDARRTGPRRTTGGVARSMLVWNVGNGVRRVEPVARRGENGWRWKLVTHRRRGYLVTMSVTPSDPASVVTVRTARGEGAPMLGWYSPRHGEFRPSTAIVAEITGSAVIETRLEPSRRGVGSRGH